MPSIDFDQVRELVKLDDVLLVTRYQRTTWYLGRCRGPCPFKCSEDFRCVTVDPFAGKWCCHACKKGGNALDLYLALTGQDIHAGSLSILKALGKNVPYLERSKVRKPRERRDVKKDVEAAESETEESAT